LICATQYSTLPLPLPIRTSNGFLVIGLSGNTRMRMKHKSAQLEDGSKLRKVKKSIAQVKTIIKEKQA
jgi:large subunit ribosomal protein L29